MLESESSALPLGETAIFFLRCDFGWDRWIRTTGMTESKSAALPLGYIPVWLRRLDLNQRFPTYGAGEIDQTSLLRYIEFAPTNPCLLGAWCFPVCSQNSDISGIPLTPTLKAKHRSLVVSLVGLEPTPYGLKIRCSTNWAKETYCSRQESNLLPYAHTRGMHIHCASWAYSAPWKNEFWLYRW